jgi:predicted Zn-dependent protease with MMP-like domain/curved DNA-binding protein CbpA
VATSTRRESSFEEPLHGAGEPDYYAILGLTAVASDEDIRQAYRSLAKRWHPDHYAMAPEEVGRQAERRMRAINRAHDVLGDPALRRDYDRRHGVGAEDTPYWSDVAATTHRRRAYGYGQHGTFASHVPVSRYEEHAYGRHAANGTGMFFALLSVILAVAIGGRMLSSNDGSFVATSISLLAVMVLLGLAAFFATDDSLLARAATAYLEHEPKMAADTQTRHRHTSGSGQAEHDGRHPHSEHGTHEGYEGRHPAFDEDEEPTPFEQLVDEALASIPEQFAEHMRNVVVRVKDEPDEEALRRMNVPPGHTLLGLYEGVPLTHQGVHGAQPEIVTIYQGPIERYCDHNADRIRAQVRATVVHELAHHFGIDHDDMPEWVK